MSKYKANIIAKNMYTQISNKGQNYSIMKEISDHRYNNQAVTKDEGYTTKRYERQSPKITTKGWELLAKWKGRHTSWIALKDLKEFNPIEMAKYAIANQIDTEPVFVW